MKISVIMPTYNDEKTILESIKSLESQKYDNWELLIVNDGSTDDTEIVINKYILDNRLENKIKFYSKENADQLNAIKYVINKISGDFVYILHSDDLLNDESFNKFKSFYIKNPNFDAYLANKIDIDKFGKTIQSKYTKKYNNSFSNLALLELWLGRNLYIDFAFWKAEIFKSVAKDSYLDWNIPFWVNTSSDELRQLKLKNLDYYTFKYRVYEDNYINNEIGNLNVLNGEIRMLSFLTRQIYLPLFEVQYYIFKIFNKLNLLSIYKPIFIKKKANNIHRIIKFAVKKRLHNYQNNIYFNSIISFYKNRNNSTLNLEELPSDFMIYLGSDMRSFNTDLLNNNLHPYYSYIFKEMEKGFGYVTYKKQEEDKIVKLLKFLSIYSHVNLKPVE